MFFGLLSLDVYLYESSNSFPAFLKTLLFIELSSLVSIWFHFIFWFNNKPILSLIKPSLFNIFSNGNNYNKETSFLNPINRLKTEENNANNL